MAGAPVAGLLAVALALALAVALAVALAGAVALAAAQTGPAVALRLAPKVGDTLRTRFEQDVVMTGATKVHGRDTTLVSSTSMLVLARLVVQASDARGCTLLAITDSVALLTLGAQALTPGESSRRAMQGQRIVIRLAPDGSSAVINAPADLDPALGSFATAMPSLLPGKPVAVGTTWESAMPVPVGGDAGPGHGARLRVRYHFDSVGADGALAFVTLHGSMARDSADAPVDRGARLASVGEVAGVLVLDRLRGWWSDSKLVLTLHSVVTPAAGNDAPPVRIQTRVTQRLHTDRAPGAPPPP